MAKILKSNIYTWLKTKLNNTASTIKMNGTQSAGSSDLIARADHVHPTDTSRAASSHTHGNVTNDGAIGSTANKPVITTTSGKLTTGNFEATASNIKMNGTQSVGSLNTFARGDHVHPTDTSRAASSHTHSKSEITDFPSTMTPTSHTHGNLQNDGKVGTSNNASKNVVTDSNGKITTEAKPTIPSANTTATNIKMNGTQSAGSASTFAKADHVHPTDTSRAPNNHATSETTYGVGSASNYGHVKVDNSLSDSSTNPVQNNLVKSALDLKQNEVETQAKVTEFVNKDRVNIDRLLYFVDKYGPLLEDWVTAQILPVNAYSLKLEGVYLPDYVQYSVTSENDKLAAENVDGMDLFCSIYKNGEKQESTTQSVTFKMLDGTVLGTSNTNSGDGILGRTQIDDAIVLSGISLEDDPFGVGIYYLYAEATIDGSVVRSNILSVFVKDTNNILNHNIWSGSDYNKDLSGIYRILSEHKVISSNEYSSNGEQCFKITSLAANKNMIIARVNGTSNKTVTAKLNARVLKGACVLRIHEINDNTVSDVVIQEGHQGEVTVNKVLNVTGNIQFMFRTIGSGTIAFIDDINLVLN